MRRPLRLPAFSGITPSSLLRAAAVAALVLLLPPLVNNGYFNLNAIEFAYTLIVVLGLNFLLGLSGLVSLGHVGFFALGAYAVAILQSTHHAPYWLTLPIATVLAAAAGALMALPLLRTKGHYLAMITIAFGLIIGIGAENWVGLTNGPMGIQGISRPRVPVWLGGTGHALTDAGYFYFIAAFAALAYLFTLNLMGGRVGRTYRALGNSEIAAETLGVDVYRWKVMAFAYSAALGGLAGAFFPAVVGYVNSDTFIFDNSVLYLIGVIAGGSGTRLGPLVGTAIVLLVPQLFATLPQWQLMSFGAILLFTLIVLPEGIVGSIEKALGRRRPRREAAGMPAIGGQAAPARPEAAPDRGVATAAAPAPAPAPPPKEKPNGSPLLQVRQLTKDFTGLRAVNAVDLEIRAGALHGLIGPNGSGKSTLVNLLTGVYRASAGDVLFGGVSIANLRPHALAKLGIARTFQNLQIFGDLTAAENVLVGFHTHMRAGFFHHMLRTRRAVREEEEFRQRAVALLDVVGLAHLADERAANLPYGMQKLVEIARALALGPRLLLLDEPAAGLSLPEVEELTRVLHRLRDTGLTILLIEHHVEMVMELSDHVAVLDFGSKIAEGSPQTVVQNPKVITAYLGAKRVAKGAAG